MSAHLRSWIAVSLVAASFPPHVFGQATNQGDKKCAPPRAIYNPDAPVSRSWMKSPVVILSITVDEKGRVLEPKVRTSSGNDKFDRDFVNTVQRWRFEPATCDGKPIPARTSVQVDTRVTR